MNKTFCLTFAATLVLLVAASAHAGGPRYGPPGYGAHGPPVPHHGGAHRPYRYKHRHHDSDGDEFVKVAAGALVLGTIIYAINHSSRSQQKSTQGPAPAPTSAPIPQPAASPADYWYRIDSDGRCVMVHLNSEGREVWTDVDSEYCE